MVGQSKVVADSIRGAEPEMVCIICSKKWGGCAANQYALNTSIA